MKIPFSYPGKMLAKGPGSGYPMTRWMMFVDGQNLAMRGRDVAKILRIPLQFGSFYSPDEFLWMPGNVADQISQSLWNWIWKNKLVNAQGEPREAYYWTETQHGDAARVEAVKKSLRALGFTPCIRAFPKGIANSDWVDEGLKEAMLRHARQNDYDDALLIAGDEDYVEAVKRVRTLGRRVYLAFFEPSEPRNQPAGREAGLCPQLRLEANGFINLGATFWTRWTQWLRSGGIPDYREWPETEPIFDWSRS